MNGARANLAHEAARILATEGQNNYQAAKKKAAARLGVSDQAVLPSNLEIKDALRQYLALYGGEDHLENVSHLRRIAIAAMQDLDHFSPRLVGSVLDGTATEHSHIGLHVFCDNPDELVIYFLDREFSFQQEERQIRWHDGSFLRLPVLLLSKDERTIELMVFSMVHLRQSPPSPIDGKPQIRATRLEVEALLRVATEDC